MRRSVQLGWREARVLADLVQAGAHGIIGLGLVDRTWRFGSAIHILRKKGFKIKSDHIRGRHWRYTLESKLPEQLTFFK